MHYANVVFSYINNVFYEGKIKFIVNLNNFRPHHPNPLSDR